MGNLEKFKTEFNTLKGQFVITDNNDVQQLISIVDGEIDYYYVTFDGKKTMWHSCVGGIIPLKGFIQNKHYNRLIRIARLNFLTSNTMFQTDVNNISEKHQKDIDNANNELKNKIIEELNSGNNKPIYGIFFNII